jgi:bacterial/archaeal transporter family-2 protein
MRIFLFFLFGMASGAMIAFQSVFSAGLGKRTGLFGSVLLLTIVSIVVVLGVIAAFPASASLRRIPGPSEWYLYLGGVLGILILAAPIFLTPRIGVTATLTAVVAGQLTAALLMDHFGFFGTPRIPINLARLLGFALLAAGAVLITRK